MSLLIRVQREINKISIENLKEQSKEILHFQKFINNLSLGQERLQIERAWKIFWHDIYFAEICRHL